MCDSRQTNASNAQPSNSDTDRKAQDAARSLARLMERQLGYDEGHIDQIALRLFIRAYWSRVSGYAHTIHEQR